MFYFFSNQLAPGANTGSGNVSTPVKRLGQLAWHSSNTASTTSVMRATSLDVLIGTPISTTDRTPRVFANTCRVKNSRAILRHVITDDGEQNLNLFMWHLCTAVHCLNCVLLSEPSHVGSKSSWGGFSCPSVTSVLMGFQDWRGKICRVGKILPFFGR